MRFTLGLVLTFLTLFSGSAKAESPSQRIQWLHRFSESRAHASALTGCYGTASYQYVLPSVEDLLGHRKALRDRAQGFAWSSQLDPKRPGNVFTVELDTGAIVSRPRVSFPSPKGQVFCKCRRDDLFHCTPSNLPRLQGAPIFFSHPDAADPKSTTVWTDPDTRLVWHYRWRDLCWPRAKEGCTEDGKRLPTLKELEATRVKIMETAIGERVKQTGKPVWSSNEDPADKSVAWALQFPENRAERRAKSECLTALCVFP